MMRSGIKYRYALNLNREIVDVFALSEADRGNYECISCGQILRPVMGEVRQNHFRHQIDVNCSQETYLHKLGKLLFYQLYRQCLAENTPFEIEYLCPIMCVHCDDYGPCTLGYDSLKYDLTRAFPHIRLETPDGAFIPDLLLWNDGGEKLYVEIAVTHLSTESKRSSGARIVELSIAEEADLEMISSCCLSELDDRVEFFNFQVNAQQDHFTERCTQYVNVFILWRSGKSLIKRMTRAQFKEEVRGSKPFYFKIVPYADRSIYIEALERAYLKGFKVKNCFLCRYHAVPTSRQWEKSEKPVFCKFLKKSHESNDAAECQYYRPDPDVFCVYEGGDLQGVSFQPHELQPSFGLASNLDQNHVANF